MPPFIATLLAQGLGLLGNAVISKGKDVIEEKLGIDIDAATQTPEGLLKLRQLEADHEEFLLINALEDKRLDIENTKSARDMNTRINESSNASWLSKNIPAVLAIMVVMGGGSMLAFSPDADVRTAAVGLVTLVLGFYFGSTSSSSAKDQTISDMSGALK